MEQFLSSRTTMRVLFVKGSSTIWCRKDKHYFGAPFLGDPTKMVVALWHPFKPTKGWYLPF